MVFHRSNSVISLSSTSSSIDLSFLANSGLSKGTKVDGKPHSSRESTAKLPILFKSDALIANSERVQQQTYKIEKFR